MKGYKAYPLIAEVDAKPNKRLLVRFRNGVTKLYDCKRILALPAFEPLLESDALFRHAHADKHGYGVIWNDELDLAESEVWIGGRVVREEPVAYGSGAGEKAARTSRTKRKGRARKPEDRKAPHVRMDKVLPVEYAVDSETSARLAVREKPKRGYRTR